MPVDNKAGEGVTLSSIKHKFDVGGKVAKCERLGGLNVGGVVAQW